MFGGSEVQLPEAGRVAIGFSTAEGALSWFIRKATRSLASHSFLLYYSEQFQQHMVLEVQGRGFVQIPFEDWRTHNELLALFRIDRDEATLAEAMAELGKRLGDPYDTLSLVGFSLIFLFQFWDRNDLDDKKKLVCSEMVALFLRWSGIPINAHIDRVIPEDLWGLAAQTPESFTMLYESRKGKKKLPKVCKKAHPLLDPNCES